jgi:hypothetical protein
MSEGKRVPLKLMIGQLLLLLVIVIVWFGPSNIIDPDIYIGQNTRDIFDHIALIDHWSFSAAEWNYPQGGTLIPPDLYSMLLASPWMFLGRGVAFDIAVVLQVWLNCFAGWLLGRRFGSPILGAVSLGFSPYLIGQVNSGEMETLSLWPLAIMIYYLSNNRSMWGGFWAALTAIGSWYYGAYAAILLTLWTIFQFYQHRTVAVTKGIGAFVTLIAIPAFVYSSYLSSDSQMFRGPDMHTYIAEQPRALAGFSSDPMAWLGSLSLDANHVDALGWIMVLFASVGCYLFWRERNKDLWWLLATVFLGLCLSLGPILHIDQSPVWDWMPYDLLMWIPPLDIMRLPHRWTAVAVIGISCLVARGARDLPLAATVLILGEALLFSGPPIQYTTLKMPEIINHFEGPVLQLPTRTMEDDVRGEYLVMQKVHQFPIPYSLLMQGWSSAVSQEPLAIAITAMDSTDPIGTRSVEARQFRQEDFSLAVAGWEGNELKAEQVKQRLRDNKFRHVCLHIDRLDTKDTSDIIDLMIGVLGEPDIRTEGALLWNL